MWKRNTCKYVCEQVKRKKCSQVTDGKKGDELSRKNMNYNSLIKLTIPVQQINTHRYTTQVTQPNDALGSVSLTFCEFYKIFSRHFCHAEIVLLIRIPSHALGTCTKFQLEILTIKVISVIVHFPVIILKSLWNVSETTPRLLNYSGHHQTY